MAGFPLDALVIVAALGLLWLLKTIFDLARRRLPPAIGRYFYFPSPLSLIVAVLLFLVSLVALMSIPTYFSHRAPDCSLLSALQSQSVQELVLYLGAFLTAAWLIARFNEDVWLFHGFGTKMYVSHSEPPQPTIGTKWLVAVLVPLLPVRTYEILAAIELTWDRKEYASKPLEAIDWDQVTRTVRRNLWIYALATLAILAVVVFSGAACL